MRYLLVVVTVVLAAPSHITAFDVTTVGPASSSAGNLTLVLLTPFDGDLGFERNTAASTQALQQAHADGLLPGISITYVEIYVSVTRFSTRTRSLTTMTDGRQVTVTRRLQYQLESRVNTS